MATVERIADVLGLEGDTDPVDARRAKAIAVLAQPALALELLLRHVDDADAQGQEPDTDHADHADEVGEAPDAEPDRSLVLRSPVEPRTERDLRRARPRVVLHLHLSDSSLRAGDGLVRPEHGDALTLAQVHEWLSDTGCAVTVRPVVDPVETSPVDAYETPYRLRDALFLRNPVDVFPFGNATSRSIDLDHTAPYVPLDHGGPPGQTGLHNLGPLTRSHHRAVTLAGWRRRQPDPGTYLFRSPNGHVFLTTNQGTLRLGRSPFGEAVWEEAASRREPVEAAAARSAAA